MTSDRHSIFSFFAGSGFLDLGFETSDFNIVYFNEIYASFLEAYRFSRANLNLHYQNKNMDIGYHHGEEADVTKLTEAIQSIHLRELVTNCHNSTNIIGFIGGHPCPDFYINSKNKRLSRSAQLKLNCEDCHLSFVIGRGFRCIYFS
ncbi:DNA cytosine methyltransferase [Fischerella sp. PCC 9605]|uniref:DNA cytosine methyltransferase n=1 Tax=Fischerella sp. PCC 9605 TaxID=1173024 RepID=UPI000479307F